LFDNTAIDVRLSLRTADRLQARNRGAVLTASTDEVVQMLDGRMKAADARLTEEELTTIARRAYGELLARTCDDQRATPHLAAEHSVANHTWADYYDRLTRNGGHVPLVPNEEQALRISGWDAQRVQNLKTSIEHVLDGNPPISRRLVDLHLRELGYEPHDGLRKMVERALYPYYRDACRAAERQLQSTLESGALLSPADPQPQTGSAQPVSPVSAAWEPHSSSPPPTIPSDWIHCTPAQAAERMIAETPRLLEHRAKGKRARDAVGEQTHRQIRWAATLLEKSLPVGTPLWKVTKADIVLLDKRFDELPISFGKSPADRDPSMTLEAAAALALEKVDQGELEAGDIGLSTGTTNKHFNKLGQIHRFMLDHVDGVAAIDFTKFTQPLDQDERDARTRLSREQGRAIFSLPPWTGCAGINDRLNAGDKVIHDGLFFVLLLVWYTGARREELCKLMLDDVEERHGITYLLIRPTQTGRVKNKSARRVNAVADELLRLARLIHRAWSEGLAGVV
jgi:hypothetical protein